MTGGSPSRPASAVTTRHALPSGVRRLAASGIPFGDGLIGVGVQLDDELWLENLTSRELEWSPVVARDDRFHDPHLGGPHALGPPHSEGSYRVAPGERRSIPL